MSLLREAAIMVLVAAVLLVLMPCSPLTIWGSAYCPITPAVQPATVPASGESSSPSTALDFNRDVILASATQPVLVDYHAAWCPPCKRLAPEIAALASVRGDRLRVVKIDVDQHGALAQAQGVSSIPDVRLWVGGKEIARFAGYRSQAEIATWIDQVTVAK